MKQRVNTFLMLRQSCLQSQVKAMQKIKGFSLIELMIAMVIGLIIINGVIQVVLNSKRSYIDNQEMSQMQENARYALDTLTREIRMAGYMGCAPTFAAGAVDTSLVTTNIDYFLTPQNAATPITGLTKATVMTGPFVTDMLMGTDAIVIRRASAEFEVVTDAAATETPETLNFATGTSLAALKPKLPLLISSPDCSKAVIVEGTEVNGNQITGVPKPTAASLSPFVKGSAVTPLVVNAYYIGASKVVKDTPALMREVMYTTAAGAIATHSEELALGVEDMQLIYVTQASAEKILRADMPPADLSQLIAVEVQLLLRSQGRLQSTTQVVKFNGNNIGVKDSEVGFTRQVVSTTVGIRNRGGI